jgi:dinuclear metal center YbgI/SA1388 family protein
MATLSALVADLDDRLGNAAFPGDPSNNGLQVEGNPQVKKAAFGVDASLEIFKQAANRNADFLFVHHGLSWGSGFRRLIGPEAARMNVLFRNGISLYASHLPLDAHPELGHNRLIAKWIGLQKIERFAEYGGGPVGIHGSLPKAISAQTLQHHIETKLQCHRIGLYGNGPKQIRRIGVISGNAGSDGILAAKSSGLDCLITGEIGHIQFHPANEAELLVVAIGHYQSETPGVLAVMAEVKRKFSIECEFIDIPTGL